MAGGFRRGFLRVLNVTLNPVMRALARSGHGPVSLIRHVGRKSGREYVVPVMLARIPDAFVAELTYGPQVQWYRNIVAAGGCQVLHHGRVYLVDGVEDFDTEAGLRAFGAPRSWVLRALNRTEFRRLRLAEHQPRD
jgi:deazaflavin-dependent oxidoreductase (nitroreductase family)